MKAELEFEEVDPFTLFWKLLEESLATQNLTIDSQVQQLEKKDSQIKDMMSLLEK